MAVNPDAEKKGFEPGTKMRVTGVGKILRKSKLDELPQLLNVLLGEMAFVGPRPEVQPYIELYPERWSKVLAVRPGITDPASIKYRNEEEILATATDPEKEYREVLLPRKLDLYEQYIREVSLITDIKLVVQTILAVVFGTGTAEDQ